MLSGNLKRGIPTLINKYDILRILTHVNSCGYTGLILYADGNFTSVYEGKLGLIDATRVAYTNTPRYDTIVKLITHPVKTRNFSKFRIGLCGRDTDQDVRTMDECFVINPENLQEAIPNDLSIEFKTLLKTFARVNNIHRL